MICAPNRCLPFVFATVLEEVGAETNLRPLSDHAARAATNDGTEDLAGDSADLELLTLRCLCRTVAQDDVTQLMSHDAGNLSLGSRRLQHAAVEKHGTTRKRERIDVTQIDDVEGIAECRLAEIRRDVLDQPLPDVLDVFLGALIVQQWKLLTHFAGRLTPQLHILLRRIAVLRRRNGRLRRRRSGKRDTGENCHQ